jgi:hypothetical protein
MAKIDLAKAILTEDQVILSIEDRDGRRILIARTAAGLEYPLDDPSDGYSPGNPGAVTALAYIRDRYAEPRYRLEILAGWREWAYLGSASARGLWHMVFHRGQFPIPPNECRLCLRRHP